MYHFQIYDKKGIHYSKAIFEITTDVQPVNNGIHFELKSFNPEEIRYTTDGSEPDYNAIPYKNPIAIKTSQTIKAAYFENQKQKSATMEQSFFISKSSGKAVKLKHPPHENYALGGSFTLVDGMLGNSAKYGRDWLGFWGYDVDATIDFGFEESFSSIALNTLLAEGSWIYYPKEIIMMCSDDGRNFEIIQVVKPEEIAKNKGRIKVNFPTKKAKYVKVLARNSGTIADGKPGAGSKAWLFVDEISIE
jgi:hexosaminidase